MQGGTGMTPTSGGECTARGTGPDLLPGVALCTTSRCVGSAWAGGEGVQGCERTPDLPAPIPRKDSRFLGANIQVDPRATQRWSPAALSLSFLGAPSEGGSAQAYLLGHWEAGEL